MANPLRELSRFGQSVWLDNISRELISSGQLTHLVEHDGLRGLTSNSTIFEKAISESHAYDQQFKELVQAGTGLEQIFEKLVLTDIRAAADVLRPTYDHSGGRIGFVSYEVSPLLARHAESTIAEVHRLAGLINRPNVMIEIPATRAGLRAVERLTADGMNINITLLFSMRHYQAAVEAYIAGLEARLESGRPIDKVASVASVFLSRIDTLIDRFLDENFGSHPELTVALRGNVAIASAKLIYERFKEICYGPRFRRLTDKGARVQRLLWASTATKDPSFSDVKYVEGLIGPETVNTMPPATMNAFRDHGVTRLTLEEGVGQARETMGKLTKLGIDLDVLGDQLQEEGLALFARSYEALGTTIATRARELGAAARGAAVS